MPLFKADLHVHTQLSPCGDLQMSPENIIRTAKRKNIDILAITDHNTTKQTALLVDLGRENGIFVLPGCEVNTREEVHVVTIFENVEIANEFQKYLDEKLPFVQNNVDLFGYQVVVDRNEYIVEEEERALFVALNASIHEIEAEVHRLGGLFIPSHIERKAYGLLTQLGFVPDDLQYDALEISYRTTLDAFFHMHPELNGVSVLRNSDAHLPEHLARVYSEFEIDVPDFAEIKMAIHRLNGRKVHTK